jgi:hypothetical protein
MAQSATFTDRKRCNKRWTGLNVLLMIVGFVLFWPLGLAMLAWIVWGDEISRMADEFKSRFGGMSQSAPVRRFSAAGTGNMAFDEYRARELERLEEERRKIEAMRSEFEEFLREVRRAKDQEEFEKFMAAFEQRTAKTGKSPRRKGD